MTPRRPLAALVALVALLAGIASLAGILLRGDLATIPWTTLRGETIDAVSGGIYAWNALPVVSEGVGWDLVTLVLAVPGALLAAAGMARGSYRATLVALGLLVYFLYQYAEYAMFWAIGPLYPLHVLLAALSLSATALLVAGLDVAGAARRFGPTFPRRAVAGLGIFMVVVLSALWLPTVWRVVVGGEVQGLLNGGSTLVVPAFDLGFLVPLGVFTAVAAWRRLPAGYILGHDRRREGRRHGRGDRGDAPRRVGHHRRPRRRPDRPLRAHVARQRRDRLPGLRQHPRGAGRRAGGGRRRCRRRLLRVGACSASRRDVPRCRGQPVSGVAPSRRPSRRSAPRASATRRRTRPRPSPGASAHRLDVDAGRREAGERGVGGGRDRPRAGSPRRPWSAKARSVSSGIVLTVWGAARPST